MKKLFILLFGMFLFFNTMSAQSIGCKLAMLDTGKSLTDGDLLSKRYSNILHQLTLKYIESEERICDISVVGKRLLNESGIDESMINIMEGILKLRDLKTKTKKYSENVSIYVAARQNGNGHYEALSKLQDLLSQVSMETIVKMSTGE
jgi:hypothetical protein